MSSALDRQRDIDAEGQRAAIYYAKIEQAGSSVRTLITQAFVEFQETGNLDLLALERACINAAKKELSK